MDKRKNEVAIVTGASAGIGAAISKALVQSGMKVVGLARRVEKIDQIAAELGNQPGKLYSVKTDLTKEQDILDTINWTTKNVGPVTVLVNNAAIVDDNNWNDGNTEKWRTLFDTNVMAVAIASREAIKIMKEHNIDGYIININSIGGHFVLDFPHGNPYSATKYALRAMTENLRLELSRQKSNIRVTSISPGGVRTEIALVNNFVTKETMEKLAAVTLLEGEDIAQAVLYLLGTPLRVQVTELMIRPIREGNVMSVE